MNANEDDPRDDELGTTEPSVPESLPFVENDSRVSELSDLQEEVGFPLNSSTDDNTGVQQSAGRSEGRIRSESDTSDCSAYPKPDNQQASDLSPAKSGCKSEIPATLALKQADQRTGSNGGLNTRRAVGSPTTREVHPVHLATSTFLSLVMVLGLLLLARLLVPSLVESIRYGWYRGQLRAEYEISGEQLKSVSLDNLADVSQLVSRRMGPSVVHINVLKEQGDQDLNLGVYAYEGQGSGFVIDASGLILTNDHVLEGGAEIEVTFTDGRKLMAEIVGRDENTDLAVIQVPAKDLMPIEWGDSKSVVVGTPVWAVGSPFGLQQTVTFGIISGKHRVDFRTTQGGETVHGGNAYGDLMQSDVALNPGNSGGPLVNSLGQVVGVNAAILGNTFRGVSFSIPSRVAQQVSQHLIEEGFVPRGWLGVELAELSDDEKFAEDGHPRPGVRVRRFPANIESPAKRSGLRIGDLITTYQGVSVSDTASLIRMIGETPVGTEIVLGVERQQFVDGSEDGETEFRQIEIKVTLSQRNRELDQRIRRR